MNEYEMGKNLSVCMIGTEASDCNESVDTRSGMLYYKEKYNLNPI